MGYNESSKAYKIYILGSKKIEVSRDVSFEEQMAIYKERGPDMDIDDNEDMGSSPPPTVQRELPQEESSDSIDPVEPVNAPTDMAVSQKRPRWAQQTLQDVEGHEAPHRIHREIKRP